MYYIPGNQDGGCVFCLRELLQMDGWVESTNDSQQDALLLAD